MKLETLNDIFFNSVARNLPRVMTFKQGGQWINISSQELYRQVAGVARSLQAWGLGKGDHVAILSENRPEWPIADFACLLLGIVDVPIYATLPADQIVYLLNNSEARAIFVSTKEQLQKVLQIRAQTRIEKIVLMEDSEHSEAIPFRSLIANAPPERDPALDAIGEAIKPDDLATIIYTSGTTGTPKGAMLTHGNIASNISFSLRDFGSNPCDLSISYLPLSHITARHLDYYCLYSGVTLAYCPHLEDLPQTLMETRPTILVSVPRVYEKVYNKVMQETRSGIKRSIYEWAIRVGRAHRDEILAGRIPSSWEWKVANVLLFSKIYKGFGGQTRAFISGGAPLGIDLATWFADMGIVILQGYGLTETSPVIAINTPQANRLGTVGKRLPNVEIKIAEDGELLVRGPNVFHGYWKLPEESQNAFVDGWFKTGDIAALDSDGFLSITDRKKDLIKTSGGKFIAPQPLENQLKSNPLVSQAAIIGDRRKFPAVIIAPQFPVLEDWARENNVSFSSHAQLITNPKVQELYQGIIEGLNAKLAQFEKLKKVLLVPDEFSIATGELTPSMKLKRRFVEQKYKAQIDDLYTKSDAGVTV
ncbi:MAG TPA: long-chain fatty acid--CoA ligase [Terriglobales bacterium]|jgi:long-chain acyl-CoA synthetase|nr:long-chain fatty acid--CoA ligase [Terriglobales bacterium]